MSCDLPVVISFEDFLHDQDASSNKTLGKVNKPASRNKISKTVCYDLTKYDEVNDSVKHPESNKNHKLKNMKCKFSNDLSPKYEEYLEVSSKVMHSKRPLKRKQPCSDKTIRTKMTACTQSIVNEKNLSINAKPSHTFTELDHLSDPQWTEKHRPEKSCNIAGNIQAVNKLITWLQSWKDAIKKMKDVESRASKRQKSAHVDDSDDDFQLSEEDRDIDECDSAFLNTMLVLGPTSSGKTSAVYTCAEELGFKVLEINASKLRSSKAILSELEEATQSHLVSKQQNGMSTASTTSSASMMKKFFSRTKRSNKQKVATKMECISSSENTLVLIDEADVVLEPDKGFWSAIHNLADVSKRPLIVTSSRDSCPELEGRCEEVHFNLPTLEQAGARLQTVSNREGLRLSNADYQMLVRCSNCELRSALLNLQFWADSLAGDDKLPDETGKCDRCMCNNIPSRIFGIADIPCNSSVQHHNHATHNNLERLFFHLHFHKLSLHSSIFHSFSLHSESENVKTTPLMISSHAGEMLTSSGTWSDEADMLSLAFNRKQPNHTPPQPPTSSLDGASSPGHDASCDDDALCDDDASCDDGASSLPAIHKELTKLMRCFDVMSYHDLVMYDAGGDVPSNLHLMDGDCNELGIYGDSHPTTYSLEMLSYLSAAAMKLASDISTDDLLQACLPPSSLYPSVCRYMAGGLPLSREQHLDFLPYLRSLCRVEERRRKAGTSRRFFHYLNSISFHVTPQQSRDLATEFIFSSNTGEK